MCTCPMPSSMRRACEEWKHRRLCPARSVDVIRWVDEDFVDSCARVSGKGVRCMTLMLFGQESASRNPARAQLATHFLRCFVAVDLACARKKKTERQAATSCPMILPLFEHNIDTRQLCLYVHTSLMLLQLDQSQSEAERLRSEIARLRTAAPASSPNAACKECPRKQSEIDSLKVSMRACTVTYVSVSASNAFVNSLKSPLSRCTRCVCVYIHIHVCVRNALVSRMRLIVSRSTFMCTDTCMRIRTFMCTHTWMRIRTFMSIHTCMRIRYCTNFIQGGACCALLRAWTI